MKSYGVTIPSFIHFSESVQRGSNFWVCGWNHKGWPFKWKLRSRSFLWHRLLFVYERSIVAIQLKTRDPLYPSQANFLWFYPQLFYLRIKNSQLYKVRVIPLFGSFSFRDIIFSALKVVLKGLPVGKILFDHSNATYY